MSPGGGGRAELDGLRLAWVQQEDLPAGEGWLTPPEREVLKALRLEKRRGDWLLGRWAAKLAVRSLLGRAAPDMSVLADEGGRPRVHLTPSGGTASEVEQGAVSLSISHSAGTGFAAAAAGELALGCDVEAIEPRSEAFIEDYFTEGERGAVRAVDGTDRALLANLVWSAKESALKAMGEGLRQDTRSVEVQAPHLVADGDGWSDLVVTGVQGRIFRGQWRVHLGLVWTVLTESR